MADDLAREAVRLWDTLDADWGTYLTHCQEVANYLLPDRADYTAERAPGQKRMSFVYDATPIFALDMSSSGLHSLLTNAELQWFNTWTEDDRINNVDRVRVWLAAADDAMYRVFSGPKHNFAAQSHELYLDELSVGTAVMAVLESQKSGYLFSTRHLKECRFTVNDEDRVDTLVRKWQWTAHQAVQQWGIAAVGEKVAKAYVDKPETKFWFIHMVRPRRERNPGRTDAKNKAWESVYVSVDDLKNISVGGFDEFPYLVPRFSKLTGEVFGRGPGMLNLPDIKMLNELSKLVIKAAQKIIDPPLQIPDDGFLVPIKTVPGGQNFYRADGMGRIEPIKTGGDIQIGVEMLNALRQQIMRGFYTEWMMLPPDPRDPAASGKGVTATYVLQQRDEKMRLLSPMLARLQAEFLGPLIDRVFAMMWRQSVARRFGPGSPFPPPPPELSGQKLRIEYVSPLSVAQKSASMDAVTKLLQQQLMLRQIDPQSQIQIDVEGIMRLSARDWNAPPGVLRAPEVLAQERQQKAESEQAMAQHMQLTNIASAAKDGTGALKNLADAHATVKGAADTGDGDQTAEAA